MGETITVETVLAPDYGGHSSTRISSRSAAQPRGECARRHAERRAASRIETANAYLDEAYAGQFERSRCPANSLMLSVTDTGTGMSRELLERVFEPFFTHQGHRQGLRPRPVDGVWLRQAVRRSRPDLQQARRRHHGQNLSAADPAAEAAANPEELLPRDVRVETAANPSENVLVVEDNDDVRHYAHRRSKNSATPCCWRATRPRPCGSPQMAGASTCCSPTSSCPAR